MRIGKYSDPVSLPLRHRLPHDRLSLACSYITIHEYSSHRLNRSKVSHKVLTKEATAGLTIILILAAAKALAIPILNPLAGVNNLIQRAVGSSDGNGTKSTPGFDLVSSGGGGNNGGQPILRISTLEALYRSLPLTLSVSQVFELRFVSERWSLRCAIFWVEADV